MKDSALLKLTSAAEASYIDATMVINEIGNGLKSRKSQEGQKLIFSKLSFLAGKLSLYVHKVKL